MKITLKWLEAKMACEEGIICFIFYKNNGGDTDSIKVLEALIKEGKLNWASWLCIRLLTHKQEIAYLIYVAEQVIADFEKKYPDDKRPRKAINAAKAVLKCNTRKNRIAANAAAYAAFDAYAADAYYPSYFAGYAAYAAFSCYAHVTDAGYDDALTCWFDDAMKIKIVKYGIKLLRSK